MKERRGKMFEWGRKLGVEPHPCYEYLGRCRCMFCMLMPDRHAAENMKRYPDIAAKWVRAELKVSHTWKNGKSLQSIFNECMDIDDIGEDILLDYRAQTVFEVLKAGGGG